MGRGPLVPALLALGLLLPALAAAPPWLIRPSQDPAPALVVLDDGAGATFDEGGRGSVPLPSGADGSAQSGGASSRLDPSTTEIQYNFSLNMTFSWDADWWDYDDLDQGVILFNQNLMDITDGQMAFTRFDLWDRSNHWEQTDVHILNQQNYRANAAWGGYYGSGGYITVGVNDYGNLWKTPNGAWTFTHEFGHYALFFPDEYSGGGTPVCQGNSVMAARYNTELCSDTNHNYVTAGPTSLWARLKANYPKVTEELGIPDPGPTSGAPVPQIMWHDVYDLTPVASSAELSDDTVVEGETVYVNMTVTNYNFTASNDVQFALYTADPDSGEKPVATNLIDVTDLTSFPLNFTFVPKVGSYELWVKADSSDQVDEDEEADNVVRLLTPLLQVHAPPRFKTTMATLYVGNEDTPLEVDLEGTATDTEDSSAQLRFHSISTGAGITAVEGNDSSNQRLTFLPLPDWNGKTTATIEVVDSDGLGAQLPLTLRFDEVNDDPFDLDLWVDITLLDRGAPQTFHSRSGDIEDSGTDLQVILEASVNGSGAWIALPPGVYQPTDGSYTTEWLLPYSIPAGIYDVRQTTTDAEGAGSAQLLRTALFEVRNNAPMVIGGFSDSDTVIRGAVLPIMLAGSDLESPPDRWRWEVEVLDSHDVWHASNATSYDGTWAFPFAPQPGDPLGGYLFRARVFDGDGAPSIWRDLDLAIAVVNVPPTLDSPSLDPSSVDRGETVTVKAHYSDPDGVVANGSVLAHLLVGDADYGGRFNLTLDGTGAVRGTVALDADIPAGRYEVALVPTDDDGDAGTPLVMGTVTLRNHDPTAVIAPLPRQVVAGTRLTLDGTGSTDADGYLVEFHWDLPDHQSADGASAIIEARKAGTYRLTLTVTDQDGASASATVVVEVTSPAPPERVTFIPGSSLLSGSSSLLPLLALMVLAPVVVLLVAMRRRRSRPAEVRTMTSAAPPQYAPLPPVGPPAAQQTAPPALAPPTPSVPSSPQPTVAPTPPAAPTPPLAQAPVDDGWVFADEGTPPPSP